MRYVCNDHGELDTVEVNGYSLGHETKHGEPSERDLEGITFTFGTTDEGEVVIESTDGADNYLSKFADWREVLVRADKRQFADSRSCPECGRPVWLLEDDEEVPKP